MGLIKYLVFDVDNTLLDFDLSLMTTQKAVADRIGYDFSEEYYLTDRELMYEAWNDYRMTETNDLEIQEHWHRHYRLQIVRHYELLMERLGMNVDPYELLRLNFRTISGMHHTMEPETVDVVRELLLLFAKLQYFGVFKSTCDSANDEGASAAGARRGTWG